MTGKGPADRDGRLWASFAEFLWIWNDLQGLATPRHHLRMARFLGASDRSDAARRQLLMAFRAAGKSTVVGLFAAWRLWLDPDLRVLILSADAGLATKMTRAIRSLVQRHPLTLDLRPQSPEQWAADRFTVARPSLSRDPSVLAAGIGGNVTGSRAELVICDDVEVPRSADSPAKRIELRARLSEIEFVLTPGGSVLYVGTPHAEDSIYADPDKPRPVGTGPAFLGGYERFVLPLQDANGASAWPERYDQAAIAKLRRRAGPRRFAAQMMLQTLSPEPARLDAARLGRYGGEPLYREANGEPLLSLDGTRLVSVSTFWDPAFGLSEPGHKQGDASVFAVVFTDEAGKYRLHRVAYLEADPSDADDPATQACRKVARIARDLHLPSVTIETNGLGRFLPALLRNVLAEEGSAASVVEHASSRNKAERIIAAFDPVLAAGRLAAHDSVWNGPFVAELAEWRPGAKGLRDDAIDAVAGCLLAEPVRIKRVLPARGTAKPGWTGAGFRGFDRFEP